jgi:hypothetical protein
LAAVVVSYLTSMMSTVSPLAAIQAQKALAERIAVQAGHEDAYCDEYGTWVRQDNDQWQLVTPALTSLSMV